MLASTMAHIHEPPSSTAKSHANMLQTTLLGMFRHRFIALKHVSF